jgi:hypothetical protein
MKLTFMSDTGELLQGMALLLQDGGVSLYYIATPLFLSKMAESSPSFILAKGSEVIQDYQTVGYTIILRKVHY